MSVIKIVLTGPESTGKSTLAKQLSEHFNGGLLPEYARSYISNLERPYSYGDIEIIAKKQINDLNNYKPKASCNLLFLDTYLIITKVWFEVVFNKVPDWVLTSLASSKIDLFLLCAPDLPWERDDLRENGGEMREWLYKEYERNLKKYNFTYKIVQGFGASRLNCAIKHVETFISERGL